MFMAGIFLLLNKDEAAKALSAGNGKIPCPAFIVSGAKS